MATYEKGDYIKFEMKDEATGESEWMWLVVDQDDGGRQVVLGRLDSQPVVFSGELTLGQEIAVSYTSIREHRKPSEF
jgi:hypothetical protein